MPRLRFRPLGTALLLAAAAVSMAADPLTHGLDIDFGRDVASRDLKGLATRSDGAIVPGPVLTDLTGPFVAELLWSLEPLGGHHWLVGTGPNGQVVEITLTGTSYTVRELAHLAEPQVFALKALSDGTVLAGTSPTGALYLLDRDGKIHSRVVLPVDSIFDILPLQPPSSSTQNPKPKTQDQIALVATGNPGRIYRVDLDRFRDAGTNAAKISDAATLAAKGITLFGEIRDRNVRRLALLADGRVAAGSAPRGNVYVFPAPGPAAHGTAPPAAPILLQENRDAEVTDLLPQPNGDLYAAIVFSTASRENRINPSGRPIALVGMTSAQPPPGSPPLPPGETGPTLISTTSEARPSDNPPERFFGRSSVVYFPAGGFAETLLSRSGLAFYRLARRGDLLLITAGEQGEILGWDLTKRLSLTFPGSIGSQLNGLAALPDTTDRYLLLRNNAPGLSLLDFSAKGSRQLETKRLDLGLPAELGNLRFDSVRGLEPDALRIEAKTSFGSDETEGWTGWTALAPRDDAFFAPGLRARYVRLKIVVPPSVPEFEIDPATLYNLPQDRPPVLAEFHLLPPNLALIPAPEIRPPPAMALGQVLNSNFTPPGVDVNEAKRKNTFLASQLVPTPGRQVATWSVTDADGDTLAYTFSIRRAGDPAWIDLAVDSSDSYVQFDTSALPDGLYRTRLVAAERAPRPAAQRLTETFETDDLLVDHTPPEILDTGVRRDGGQLVVTVHGRDARSLLDGVEFVFNNGWRETVQHPVDGILDGREETFELQTPARNVAGATAVEVRLSDQSGNTAARRLALP